MHRTRNAAYGQPYRGFESLPLRQIKGFCEQFAVTFLLPTNRPTMRHPLPDQGWVAAQVTRPRVPLACNAALKMDHAPTGQFFSGAPPAGLARPFVSGIAGIFGPALVPSTFVAGQAYKSMPGLIVPFTVALVGGFVPGARRARIMTTRAHEELTSAAQLLPSFKGAFDLGGNLAGPAHSRLFGPS